MPSNKVTKSQRDQDAALRTLIVKRGSTIAIICIVAGVVAVVVGANAPTVFTLFGMAKVTTESVGVSFVGIGVMIHCVTVRDVLKPVVIPAPVKVRTSRGRSGPRNGG